MNAAAATAPSASILSVTDLRVTRLDGDDLATVVSDIALEVARGESVAFVGESGSGKSVTAKSIMGLLPRALTAEGRVQLNGRDVMGLSEREWSGVRGREVGMIMQDPFTSLNPIQRCARIIGESLPRDAALDRAARREEVVRRLAEVGITDPSVADRYPFQLSGGMRQRVGIAAALARDPDLLIADEPTTALDVTTQRGILSLIKRIQRARNMSLILITHDLRVAFATCDRVYVMYAGSVVEVARSDELDREPLHPYSSALLLSEPPLDQRLRELVAIPGSVPAPDDVAGGCVFAPRCDWAREECTAGTPALREIEPGRWSACVRVAEVRADMARARDAAAQVPDQIEGPAAPPDAVIRVEDVSKTFAGAQIPALDGVSVDVAEGECVGLVGESGSGKTTLARAIIGLEHISSGSIHVAGVDVSAWAKLPAGAARQVRSAVQMVFQDPYSSLNPKRSIGWTLAEAVRTHAPRTTDVKGEVARLLESVGLPAATARKRPSSLSGGMRQRVAIARALVARPRVLICDESVSALDVSVQAQILNLLHRLKREQHLGVLFITHDLAVVRQIADRVYVMNRGRVVESGPTDQIIETPADPYTVQLLDAAPRATNEWLSD
ncbi:ABC transporter ATP-binding protein [Streptosporangium sp. NPDC006013]|uniref:ABC transporter ATP-binding protein n=1 Tax=Streptosporangium sp. NPDC006013 TaxID=3155596 RepID=UPI0033AAEFB5